MGVNDFVSEDDTRIGTLYIDESAGNVSWPGSIGSGRAATMDAFARPLTRCRRRARIGNTMRVADRGGAGAMPQ